MVAVPVLWTVTLLGGGVRVKSEGLSEESSMDETVSTSLSSVKRESRGVVDIVFNV